MAQKEGRQDRKSTALCFGQLCVSNRVVLHNVVRDLGAGGVAMHNNGGHGLDLYMYILHLSCASSPKFL